MGVEKFDLSAYEDNINLLLSIAQSEYERHFTALPSLQDKNIKTFLWISVVLFGFQITIIDKLNEFPLTSIFYLVLSVVFSFTGFLLALGSLKVPGMAIFGIEDYSTLTEQVYDWAEQPGSERKLNLSLIDLYEEAISLEIKNNIWRAKRLRFIVSLLSFSSLFTLLSVVCIFIK